MTTMIVRDEKEEQLRTEIIEAILAYFEGKKPFKSVIVLGMNTNDRNKLLLDQEFSSVLSQLEAMGNEIGRDKNFSREEINDVFTTMLEKMVK